ncbi:hypothetical protein CEV34_3805 [Brucella pseudogrignonensis]|uniref:Uncharacterized protein n=1 Tax=Brucella pseudogrignonensis TaxID=419475 RepID=A0A256G8T3_9HYPH|nr:hypothetical protein CEV34_3805 [Brucella pseudogrignonensis]
MNVQEAAKRSRENSGGCEAQPVAPGPSCHAPLKSSAIKA